MDLASLSLAALLVVIVVSCTIRLNPGVLAMVLAWVIALYVAPAFGVTIPFKQLAAGFPVDLFLTLVGVTLLFGLAQANGTLERVARQAVRLCRGNVGFIPMLFFVLTLVLASCGAGNIAAAALMAPLALAAAERARISPFLMTIIVAHGAIAGGMSPFAPTGVTANDLLRDRLHISGYAWPIYFHNLLANALVAFGGYFLFGGYRLFSRRYVETEPPADPHANQPTATSGERFLALQWPHRITLALIGALIVAVIFLDAHIGMAAFAAALVLIVFRLADEKKAMAALPWGVILMVCGVTVLTTLLEKTGGTDLLARLIGQLSTADTVTGAVALLTGLVSVYSSTTGVVLPAFLPLVPGLVKEVPGSDPLAIATAMIIGGNLVDSSPLSTIGALCIASAGASADRRVLFNQVLAWGLSMAVVAAAGCWLFF
jgi:Na+/H+ antiporter NhaD/arsenite permease-like protein